MNPAVGRREFLAAAGAGALGLAMPWGAPAAAAPTGKRPNILFCISDDQSWLHAGAYGDQVVRTPNFDRVAREGVRFEHAYTASPSCTPSRGGILTGQHIWRLEEGGNLWSTLPAKFPVYPDLLAQAGYHVGYARKGWAPGRIEPGGRTTNPAGAKRYNGLAECLEARTEGAPFCFWFGSADPHRAYQLNSGVDSGMDPAAVEVPPMLPDAPEVRSDICDYYWAIQRFDREVGEMLKLLEEKGELDNTIVVVTSDNGMPFPRAKANLYDMGTRMPLAIRWKERAPGGRVVEDFVSLTDLAPTFLEAAGVPAPEGMTGQSLLKILEFEASGRIEPRRDRVFTARERHTAMREGGVGYPARAMRTRDFLYIRNCEPERWPAGDPPCYGDIDAARLTYYAPTKEYMMRHRDEPGVRRLFDLATAKRPAEELYDLRKDPFQMENVAALDAYAETRRMMAGELEAYLRATGDPRATGAEAKWDKYPYYGTNEGKAREGAPI